jgi:alkanesulfonate monooxygenase SsuD/methylene tetrahydromethanopterin reductase-like flavin-dependent oxidoreductase (luciferase family)
MVDFGFFAMPVHPADKGYGTILRQNREAVILCDSLGYSEAWIGEHFTSTGEPIPDPLQFLASVISETKNIRLGTAVLNLPLHHPVKLAGQIAQFDQLCGGRAMLGIGPGGLRSDLEIFGVPVEEGYFKMVESVDIMTQLWTGEAPFDIKAEYWDDVVLKDFIQKDIGLGVQVKPLQQPHPPFAYAMRQPSSGAMAIIVERDWIPLSGNFIPASVVKQQWQAYCEASDELGKAPKPENWRAARSILVAETDTEAEDHVARENSSMQHYFHYLRSLEARRNMPDATDEERAVVIAQRVNEAIEQQIIVGSTKTVTDKLIAFREEVGPFGTLLMTGYDWDDEALWKNSIRKLAEEVMPVVSQHAAATDRV